MLFINPELISEYDYGNTLSEENLSIDALACDIVRIQSKLEELFQFAEVGNRIIHFKNCNQNNKSISISYDEVKPAFKDRTIHDIKNILFRDYRDINSQHQSIANQLLKLGIPKPNENEQFSDYLQLLYFLYMTTNVIFPKKNVLRMLNSLENDLTTENIPIKGASDGDILAFIKNNIEDNVNFRNDEEIFTSLLDKNIDDFIESIMHLEDCFPVSGDEISIEDYLSILVKSNQDVDARIPRDVSDEFLQVLFPSHRVLFLIERYVRRSDAMDVLKNLQTLINPKHNNNIIFQTDMEDSEYPLPPEWKHRYINKNRLDDFLHERELLFFCNQKKLTSKQLFKEANNEGMKDFVDNFISYNIPIVNTFTKNQENDDSEYIYAPFVACIARTYKVIWKNKVRIILTLNGQKKNMERSLKGFLKTGKGLPQMLPYKIALVLCELIYQQCTHPASSNYYWYMNVRMQTLIYIQKVLLHIFEVKDYIYWIKYLKMLTSEINNKKLIILTMNALSTSM